MGANTNPSGKLKKDLVLAALQNTSLNLAEISKKLEVSRSSIYKYAEEAWGPDYIQNRRQLITINHLKMKNSEENLTKANSEDQVEIIEDLSLLGSSQNKLPNQNHKIKLTEPSPQADATEESILKNRYCKVVFNSINNKFSNKDTFICVFKLYQEISEGLRPYMTTKEIIKYLKSENRTISTNNLCAIRHLYNSGCRLNEDDCLVYTGKPQNKNKTAIIKPQTMEKQVAEITTCSSVSSLSTSAVTPSDSAVNIIYGGLSINWTETDPDKRIDGILKILQELNLKEKL